MSYYKFVSIHKDSLKFISFDTVADHSEIMRTMDHFTDDIPYDMSTIVMRPLKFFLSDDVHMKIVYRAALKTSEGIMPFHIALLIQGIIFRSYRVFTVCFETLCIWTRFRLPREITDLQKNEKTYFYLLAQDTLKKFFYCLGKNEGNLHNEENLKYLKIIFSEIVFVLTRHVKCLCRNSVSKTLFVEGVSKYVALYGYNLDDENIFECTYEKYLMFVNRVFRNPELFAALKCTRIVTMVGQRSPLKRNTKNYDKIMNFTHTAKKEKDYCRRVASSLEDTVYRNDNVKIDTAREKVVCTGLLIFLCALRDEHYKSHIGLKSKYIIILRNIIQHGRMSSCKIYLPTEKNNLLDIRNAFPLKVLKRKK